MPARFVFRLIVIHQWKRAFRSASRTEHLATRIFVGVMVALLVLNLLGLGLFIDKYLKQRDPSRSPIDLVNGFLLYYFGFEFLLRLLVQRIPADSIEPYLLLPVRRSTLAHLFLARSAVSLFNILPYLVFLPVSLRMIGPSEGVISAVGWLTALVGLTLSSSSLQLIIRRKILERPGFVLALLACACGIGLLDYADIVPVSGTSSAIFGTVLTYPLLGFLPLVTAALLYGENYITLRRQISAEYLALFRSRAGASKAGFAFLNRFGDVGSYIALELRLLLRNRRARAQMAFAVAMVPVMIAFCAYMFSLMNFYPKPGQAEGRLTVPAEGERTVTFLLDPGQLPPDAHVYITGNHEKLGTWKPNRVPLLMQHDSLWSRPISFPEGSKLEYKFTLGSWETVMLSPDGSIHPKLSLTVERDTTVSIRSAGWKTPDPPAIFDINIIYMTLLLTLLLMLSYGQFILGWESNYLDLLLTVKISQPAYFRGKFVLLQAAGIASFLLALPVVLFGGNVIEFLAATVLYNLGVNSYVLLFLATYNRKRLDLSASIFGLQGKGSVQFTSVIPTLFAPMALYLPLRLLWSQAHALAAMAALGVVGIALQPYLLKVMVKQFQRKRYALATAFRERA